MLFVLKKIINLKNKLNYKENDVLFITKSLYIINHKMFNISVVFLHNMSA